MADFPNHHCQVSLEPIMLKNIKFRNFQKMVFLACGLLFLAQQSLAQAPDEDVAKNALELTTITVTAQKREQNVQSVPASMDVFSGMGLEEAGIADLKELSFFSPNLYVKQQTNQNMLIIRGISSHNVVLNTPAGLFVDDINYPMTFMQNPDLLDVERVEILRGPQGTLYGRNTESGAVKIITRQPGNAPYAKIFGEIGIYDTPDDEPLFYRTGASVSGPLVKDRLFLGLSAQTEDSDGYTINDLDGDDEAGKIQHRTAQGKLRWTPGDNWDIQLLANIFENEDGYGYLHYIDGPDKSERYHLRWDGNNSWKDENNGQALKLQYRGTSLPHATISRPISSTTPSLAVILTAIRCSCSATMG
jgi:iron complex outermembrane receptor protein